MRKKFRTCWGQICSSCNQMKKFEEFDLQKTKTTGYRYNCKSCRNMTHKERYKLEHVRKRSQENSWKSSGILGMTVKKYEEMLLKQNNYCAICGRTEKENNRRLCVDHDHDTGKIRELLYDKCNVGLGRFNDNLSLLYNGVQYLSRHSVKERI